MNKEIFKDKKARIIIWIVVIVAIGAFLYLTAPRAASVPTANGNQPVAGNLPAAVNVPANANAPKAAVKKPASKPVGFVEKKTPHFVSANISNNQTIAAVPSFLTLTFDAPLVKSTQTLLTVKKDDITSATMAAASIDNKSLIVRLNTQVTDGSYYVYYVACFADTGCKDGRFGYRLNLP